MDAANWLERHDERSKLFPLKVAVNEGGDWEVIWVHAIETPHGDQYDAINGARTNVRHQRS